MSAPYHDTESKLEAIFKALIEANVDATNRGDADVLTGLTANEIEDGTRITVECSRIVGRKGLIGNFMATVVVHVKTKVNPPVDRGFRLAEHRSRTAFVRDYLYDSQLVGDINAQSDVELSAQGIETEMICESRAEGDSFVSDITLNLLCCPSR